MTKVIAARRRQFPTGIVPERGGLRQGLRGPRGRRRKICREDSVGMSHRWEPGRRGDGCSVMLGQSMCRATVRGSQTEAISFSIAMIVAYSEAREFQVSIRAAERCRHNLCVQLPSEHCDEDDLLPVDFLSAPRSTVQVEGQPTECYTLYVPSRAMLACLK